MSASRPRTLVVVSGTGTDIGKTWWTAATARALRADGRAVAIRKPAQSFSDSELAAGATDAAVLGAASGEDATTVCPPHRWYELAMAPPMAAAALDRPGFTISDLVAELTWPTDVDVGFVEGAGGPRSPLADDGDTVALADALAPDAILLVADAGLGTINAVRLSAEVLGTSAPVLTVLNRFDESSPLHRANRDWLASHGGGVVLTEVDALAERLRDLTTDSR